jgi:hypothetical protein
LELAQTAMAIYETIDSPHAAEVWRRMKIWQESEGNNYEN